MTNRIKAFTLVELLVVVAILALLISILMPTLQQAREQARQAVCVTNLKHLSLGATIYANAFDDFMVTTYHGPDVSTPLKPTPHHLWWEEVLHNDGGLPMQSLAQDTSSIFWCPSATHSIRKAEGVPYPNWGLYSNSAYAINRRLLKYNVHVRLSDIEQPAERFCFADNNNFWVSNGGYNDPVTGYNWWAFLRHQGKTSMAFADGHAEKGFELPLPMYAWTSPPPYPW